MAESPAENLTYEQALAELEQIVRDLEDGQTGLEESLARYEKGICLIKRCYQQLSQAEQRIRLLTGVNEDGHAILQAFDHVPAMSTGKAEVRPQRKEQNQPDELC